MIEIAVLDRLFGTLGQAARVVARRGAAARSRLRGDLGLAETHRALRGVEGPVGGQPRRKRRTTVGVCLDMLAIGARAGGKIGGGQQRIASGWRGGGRSWVAGCLAPGNWGGVIGRPLGGVCGRRVCRRKRRSWVREAAEPIAGEPIGR